MKDLVSNFYDFDEFCINLKFKFGKQNLGEIFYYILP